MPASKARSRSLRSRFPSTKSSHRSGLPYRHAARRASGISSPRNLPVPGARCATLIIQVIQVVRAASAFAVTPITVNATVD